MKKNIQKISIALSILLLLWMLVAVIRVQFTNEHTTQVSISLSLIIGSILLAAVYYLSKRLVQHPRLLIALFLVIGMAKIPFLLFYQSEPASDIWSYNLLAHQFVEGSYWEWQIKEVGLWLWPHVINIGKLYALIYSLFGENLRMIEIFNVVLTLIDCLLIYLIISKVTSKSAGIFSSLVFLLIPSYYFYSLLGGAEPIYLTFCLLAIFFMVLLFSEQEKDVSFKWLFFACGISFSLIAAFLFRPVAPVLAIALLLWTLFRQSESALLLNTKRLTICSSIAIVSFFLFYSFSARIYQAVYNLPTTSYSGYSYSIATGLNEETEGQYDRRFQAIALETYEAFDGSEKIDAQVGVRFREETEKSFTNLKRRGEIGSFLEKKMEHFSDESYAYSLLFVNHSTNPSVTYERMRKAARPFISYSFTFYTLLIVLAILSCSWSLIFSNNREVCNKLFFSSLLINGFIIASLLVEVQGRYHIILYLPLLFLIAEGAANLNKHLK